jgi:hypothetical protein
LKKIFAINIPIISLAGGNMNIMEIIKVVLFTVFIILFLATGIITLLGICNKISIKEGYLKWLSKALIGEVVASVLALFAITFIRTPPYEIWTASCKVQLIDKGNIVKTNNLEMKPLHTIDPTIINNESDGNFTIEMLVENNNGYRKFPDFIITDVKGKETNASSLHINGDNSLLRIKDKKYKFQNTNDFHYEINDPIEIEIKKQVPYDSENGIESLAVF